MGRLHWSLAIALAVACVLTPSLSSATAAQHRCRGANAPATDRPPSAVRATVVCLINEVRTAHGLPALRTSKHLGRSAQSWVDQLVRTGSFDHGNLTARLHAAGVRFSVAAENLATGQATPGQVVSAWLSDVPHCRNILSPEFSQIGTGLSPHAIAGFSTGPSTWAADFALPRGHRAPSRNSGPASSCPLY